MKKFHTLISLLPGKGLIFLFSFLAFAGSMRAQSCQAWFMTTVDTTVNPNIVTLYDSSYAGGGTITSWQWTYNGAPVGTNGPNQTLSVPAVHNGDLICLTINTDSGCSST